MTLEEIKQAILDKNGGGSMRAAVEAIAEKTGIPYGTLNPPLYGHSGMNVESAKLLAVALGVALWDLKPLLRSDARAVIDELR